MTPLSLKSLHSDYPLALPTLGGLAALALVLAALVGGESKAPSSQTAQTSTSQPSKPQTSTVAEALLGDTPTTQARQPVKVSSANTNSAATSTAGLDKTAVEEIVRDYLMTNPEILLEVQQALEVKMTAERDARAKIALTENAAKIFRSPGDPIYGNKDGDVTVVEFFDYNCGFCKRAIPHLTQLVEADKNVKVVFKEFPIFGEESEQAALAALASGKQGKYWEMHRALMERPGRANLQKAMDIARSLNMDTAKLEADMKLPEIRQVITDAQNLAQSMGIQGTPHFLVGPETIPGAPEDLLQQIQTRVAAVRKEGCTVC